MSGASGSLRLERSGILRPERSGALMLEKSGAVNEEASGAFRLLKSDGISGSLMLAPPDSTALDRSLSAGPATCGGRAASPAGAVACGELAGAPWR